MHVELFWDAKEPGACVKQAAGCSGLGFRGSGPLGAGRPVQGSTMPEQPAERAGAGPGCPPRSRQPRGSGRSGTGTPPAQRGAQAGADLLLMQQPATCMPGTGLSAIRNQHGGLSRSTITSGSPAVQTHQRYGFVHCTPRAHALHSLQHDTAPDQGPTGTRGPHWPQHACWPVTCSTSWAPLVLNSHKRGIQQGQHAAANALNSLNSHP